MHKSYTALYVLLYLWTFFSLHWGLISYFYQFPVAAVTHKQKHSVLNTHKHTHFFSQGSGGQGLSKCKMLEGPSSLWRLWGFPASFLGMWFFLHRTPTSCFHHYTSSSIPRPPLPPSCRDLRDFIQGRLDNPGSQPHLRIFSLITSVSPFCHGVSHSQVLGIWA